MLLNAVRRCHGFNQTSRPFRIREQTRPNRPSKRIYRTRSLTGWTYLKDVTLVGIRVLLVDNQQLFTDALRTLLGLEDDIEVVAEAYDGVGALEEVRRTQPDIAV